MWHALMRALCDHASCNPHGTLTFGLILPFTFWTPAESMAQLRLRGLNPLNGCTRLM